MKNTLLLCGCLLLATAALAQRATDSLWTPQDVINQERVYDIQLSPDGQMAAWVKYRPSKEKDRFVNDLWLTRLDIPQGEGFLQVQLTRSDDSDSNPVFSADGKTLYFLSSRNSKAIWALSLYGGEPYVVDSFKTNISGLQRLDENRLTFVAEEGESLYEQKLKKAKDNVQVIEDTVHFKARRVFVYDLKEKRRTRISSGRFPVSEYALSKNGKWMVTQHIGSPHYGADGKPAPTYYLWDLETGSMRQILTEGLQTPRNFAFAADNSGFYFQYSLSSDPEWQGAGIELLKFYDLATHQVVEVDLNWEMGIGGGYSVFGRDVLVSLANKTTNRLVWMAKNGLEWTAKPLLAGPMDEHIRLAAISDDLQQAAFIYSTASLPPEYRIGPLRLSTVGLQLGVGKLLFQLNSYLDSKPKTRSEVISWTGALGDEVTGILYYPLNYQQGKAYPLMLSIHGGPSGVDLDQWQDRWSTYPHLLAQKGMFVLKPNYHGSSNHGLKFVESIKKHYYEYELPDILSGIELLVERGMVHRDSLGTMGWSAGAILTTMLTVQHPDMFRVAAPGAGDVNWTSDFGTCRFGVTFDQSYFGGAPWDNTNGKPYNEAYILKSPLFEMEKVKTPTIIFHGSEDRAVPRDQGWEYYRALQQIAQAPVRFLWFPDQPHGLQKITHQKRKMEEEIRWIDRYFFGKTDTTQSVQEGSPLLALLEREKLEKQGQQLGRLYKGKLIPQLANAHPDSLAIGVVEVTNAQYRAFDRRHSYPQGQDNYPVHGISHAQALAYTAWLRKLTGESYRLPRAEEAEALHKAAYKAATSENCLNYWAGFELTRDEVQAVQQKMQQAKGSLLLPAAHFAPTTLGQAKLYDLGGNVAEYSQEGSTYGYSAYDFVDPYSQEVQPGEKGLRVVKDLQ